MVSQVAFIRGISRRMIDHLLARRGSAAARDTEKLIERLYARIGELVVERFFRGVPSVMMRRRARW